MEREKDKDLETTIQNSLTSIQQLKNIQDKTKGITPATDEKQEVE